MICIPQIATSTTVKMTILVIVAIVLSDLDNLPLEICVNWRLQSNNGCVAELGLVLCSVCGVGVFTFNVARCWQNHVIQREMGGGGGVYIISELFNFFYYFTFNKKHIIIHDWQDVKLLSIEASRDDPSTITINSVIDMHYDKNSSSILGVVCTFCWV